MKSLAIFYNIITVDLAGTDSYNHSPSTRDIRYKLAYHHVDIGAKSYVKKVKDKMQVLGFQTNFIEM